MPTRVPYVDAHGQTQELNLRPTIEERIKKSKEEFDRYAKQESNSFDTLTISPEKTVRVGNDSFKRIDYSCKMAPWNSEKQKWLSKKKLCRALT